MTHLQQIMILQEEPPLSSSQAAMMGQNVQKCQTVTNPSIWTLLPVAAGPGVSLYTLDIPCAWCGCTF